MKWLAADLLCFWLSPSGGSPFLATAKRPCTQYRPDLLPQEERETLDCMIITASCSGRAGGMPALCRSSRGLFLYRNCAPLCRASKRTCNCLEASAGSFVASWARCTGSLYSCAGPASGPDQDSCLVRSALSVASIACSALPTCTQLCSCHSHACWQQGLQSQQCCSVLCGCTTHLPTLLLE